MTEKLFRGVELEGEPADEEVVARIAAEIQSRGVEIHDRGITPGSGLGLGRDGVDSVRYRIYFPERPPLPLARRVRALWRDYTGRDPRAISIFVEPEIDWASASREAFTGTDVGPFWVGPPWIEPPPDRRVIRVTPGRAFGTGLHPTTRLALRLLLPRSTPAFRVLDVGTGSGVLALACLALGVRTVTALDADAEALRSASENVTSNGFAGRVQLIAGSLATLAPGSHAFDLILANLEFEHLVPLLGQVVSALAPAGEVVASGIRSDQRRAFLDEAADHGLAAREELEEDGWWATALKA